MQISNTPQTNSIASNLGVSPQASKSNPRQSAQDSVQIEPRLALLRRPPPKLSRLQASYDAGTYNVSPSQIAHSILNDAPAPKSPVPLHADRRTKPTSRRAHTP